MKVKVERKVLAKILELVARKLPDAREAVERILSMTTNSTMPSETFLNQMRFAPEQQKIENIVEAFELEPILSHFEREGGVKSIRDSIQL